MDKKARLFASGVFQRLGEDGDEAEGLFLVLDVNELPIGPHLTSYPQN